MSHPLAALDLDQPKSEQKGAMVQEHEDGTGLVELWHGVSALGAKERPGGVEKRLNVLTDGLTALEKSVEGNAVVSSVQQFRDTNPELVTGVLNVAGQTAAVHAIKKGLSKFAESSQVVMEGLDAVQKLHPFIGIAVLAFKAAIQLELTRRENDAKVLVLKGLMIEMMQVLLDLQYIKDAKKVQPDGMTVEGRMQRIVQAAEQDIRNCSAVCETYMHKKFIVKLFASSGWEGKLSSFSGLFTARKDEFHFALSIHTAQGVGDVQRSMAVIDAHIRATSQDTSMLRLFRELESPKERELRQYIKDHGGPQACLDNEKYFRELQAKAKDARESRTGGGKSSKPGYTEGSVQGVINSIRDEMRSDIDDALAKDRKAFDRKFDAVQDKISELRNVVQRSSDRIMIAINAGPHNRIMDKDLHTIWKDMAWRGNVKARHFIIAVQDYFYQQYNQEDRELADAMQEAQNVRSRATSPSLSPASDGTDLLLPSASVAGAIQARLAHRELQDRWAIEYISVARVRSVLEAFDDDASGWISVKEANAFTSARPLDYSVIKWLAYWAVAFRIVSARYAQQIQDTRAHMLDLSRKTLPCNRARVEKYLSEYALFVVDCIVQGVLGGWDEDSEDKSIMEHFDAFVKAEEMRLKKGLERFAYELDAYNTLQVIVGTGRIERNILPLLHLILRRHADILALSTKVPLDDSELYDCAQTLKIISYAVFSRVRALDWNFRNQHLDPKEQFTYAYDGMFSAVFKLEMDHKLDHHEFPSEYSISDDAAEEPKVDILKYGVADRSIPDKYYSGTAVRDSMNGLWAGRYNSVIEGGDLDAWDGFIAARMLWHVGDDISGGGEDSGGKFTIAGRVVVSPFAGTSPGQMTFTRRYVSGSQDAYHYECTVKLDKRDNLCGLEGRWGPVNTEGTPWAPVGQFFLDRVLPIVAQHRPATAEFEKHAARARWRMALGAVQARVRRQLWAWSRFRQRRDIRREVIAAAERTISENDPDRYGRVWPPADDTDYSARLNDLEIGLSDADKKFYRYLAERKLKTEPFHDNALCDACGITIIGGRYRCLVCRMGGPFRASLDLCAGCANKEVDVPDEGVFHKTSHSFYKSLRTLTYREVPTVHRLAKRAITASSERFSKLDTKPPPQCLACGQHVSRPCWHCVECTDVEVFLCNACEVKQLELSAKGQAAEDPKPHHWWHVLVGVLGVEDSPPDSKPLDNELQTRLAALEQRFAAHEAAMNARLDAIERGLGTQVNMVERMENALATRMTTLEGLLGRLIQKACS